MTTQTETTKNRQKIHLLPEHLIDQIKAGEVIERPASIIKELLENSIDAGSTKIDIQIINNGMDLIAVTDNGHGIYFEDLPYAFCRHATSKITKFEDLYKLHSYGFRGEALASMSAIGRVTCTSTPAEDFENGGKIEIHGGEVKHHTKVPNNKSGTAIFVKDLFFNTPARLKFVKSQQSEKNSLKRMVNSFILCSPHISFTIQWDDKEKEIYQACADQPEKRIKDVLLKGRHGSKDLEFIQGEYEGHKITGYYSHLSSRGNAGKAQYLFANGRIFTDKQIHQTILRSLEVFWGFGMTGHYCFFIDVPTDKIDVNVHPNKTQIKFFKLNLITSYLSSLIKQHNEDIITPDDEAEYKQIEFQHKQQGELGQQSSNNFFPGYNSSDFLHKYDQDKGDFEEKSFSIQGSQNSSSQFIQQGEYLLLKNEENELKAFKISKLLGLLLQNENPLLENDTTPLLISEPFQFDSNKVQPYLKVLKEMGFSLDKIDSTMSVLRTVPNSVNKLPPRACLLFTVKYLLNMTEISSNISDNDIYTNSLASSLVSLITQSHELENTGQILSINQIEALFN
ncbi:MAG: DNA mismatch repair endonuclease MutL [Oligoflexia bacterium]|nr:DNA mismatch repair endonuclease MutL [Oligoflexia bacterium]